jgi:hypothetical protein
METKQDARNLAQDGATIWVLKQLDEDRAIQVAMFLVICEKAPVKPGDEPGQSTTV